MNYIFVICKIIKQIPSRYLLGIEKVFCFILEKLTFLDEIILELALRYLLFSAQNNIVKHLFVLFRDFMTEQDKKYNVLL
jgi:hypothetical protein